MFLGIDMGTSEVKALLLDSEHHVVGTAGSALQVSRPHPGHSEQTPADWWQATQNALASLRLKYPREYASVKAIGLSGQMHGAVLLDRNNAVLRPAILWNDTRSSLECEQMMAECPALPQIAGSLAMPASRHPSCAGATHEPAVFARLPRYYCPKTMSVCC